MDCFAQGVENGWLLDGVISQSDRQNVELWRYREGISESITRYGPYKNDLSVRISKVPVFLEKMDRLMQDICPEYEAVWYGHIGDGNLHMNLIGPAGPDTPGFEARCHEISETNHLDPISGWKHFSRTRHRIAPTTLAGQNQVTW
jgi:FAD/FMN-containing dehydrogenase